MAYTLIDSAHDIYRPKAEFAKRSRLKRFVVKKTKENIKKKMLLNAIAGGLTGAAISEIRNPAGDWRSIAKGGLTGAGGAALIGAGTEMGVLNTLVQASVGYGLKKARKRLNKKKAV